MTIPDPARARRALAITIAIAAAPAAAASITIADQSFNPDVPGYQVSEAQPGGLFDTRAADNFTAPGNFTITTASWIGAEESFFSNDFPGNIAGFVVEFFADNAGVPGASIGAETFDIADIQTVDTGFNILNDPSDGDIYRFTATLTTPIDITAGQYWFSVGALGVNNFFDDDTFFWGFSGDGDDQYAIQTPANTGFPFFIPNAFVDDENADLAFSISGIPAPGAAAPLALAAALTARRRR